MLPRAALIPPWAATVCERVGNNFVITAVLKPSATSPNAARRPAPPNQKRKSKKNTEICLFLGYCDG